MHYSKTEKCDQRCRKAQVVECTCSCVGQHHGRAQHASWMEVGEAILVRGDGQKVVTRLLDRVQAEADRGVGSKNSLGNHQVFKSRIRQPSKADDEAGPPIRKSLDVERPAPEARATAAMPPWLRERASAAKSRRVARSSRRGRIVLNLARKDSMASTETGRHHYPHLKH